MTLGASNPDSSGGQQTTSGNDRAALVRMPVPLLSTSLLKRFLIAWDELGRRNDEVVTVKQRLEYWN